MHTMGKVVISLFFITCLIFILSSCKKEKDLGRYRPEDFYGEWELVCKFLDTDSNGLDSGDQKYMANPKDSFTWNFLKDNVIQYVSKKLVISSGKWFLTEFKDQDNNANLLLHPDFENRNWVYKIQTANTQELVIYCRQLIYSFGLPRIYWYGWKLQKK